MTKQSHPADRRQQIFTRNLLGALNSQAAARVVAASGDVAMVIDRGGVIRDVAVVNGSVPAGEAATWLDRRWEDTVTADSRGKIEEMLRDAANDVGPRWREINYASSVGGQVSMRYIAVNAGEDGRVIAIGRDQRLIAELQQRLLEAQQSTEREYQRVREAESRYRLLFQLTSEAVVVVDAASRRIIEANPAAERMVGGADGPLLGSLFSGAFDQDFRDRALTLLVTAQSGPNLTAQQQLTSNGRAFSVAASFFRQDRIAYYLVRLTPLDPSPAVADPVHRLASVLERIPDAFVVTDGQMRIVAENAAFLELARLASKEQAQGQSIENFLGRPDIDRNILLSSLRQYGVLKNFATVLRNRFGETEDVDVSAVYIADGEEPCYGFTIRSSSRVAAARQHVAKELPRSVETLSQLVGRVTLKELVRETTDLVERLCIEAALELTGNNRASAAEILGLSRQSLYSKLHRHGLAEFGADGA